MSQRHTLRDLIYGLAASMVISVAAMATDMAPAGGAEPDREMRAKMAGVHEQMAACLRSDKSMSDCRSEMMKGCQELMGGHVCPMMGMGMGKHDHMMKGSSTMAPMDQQAARQ